MKITLDSKEITQAIVDYLGYRGQVQSNKDINVKMIIQQGKTIIAEVTYD